jgi:hypothetical protein
MVKKLLISLIFILFAVVIAECGKSDTEEAARLDKEYFVILKQTYDDFMINDSKTMDKKSPEEWLIEYNQLKDNKYLPIINDLKSKLKKEKTSKSLDVIKSDLLNITNSLDNLFNSVPKAIQAIKERNEFEFIKLIKAISNVEENILIYQNDYSKITTDKETFELTLNNYQKINPRSPYLDVIKTFKMPGKLEKNSYINGSLSESYIWESNGAKVKMIFKNTVLESMEQEGLK